VRGVRVARSSQNIDAKRSGGPQGLGTIAQASLAWVIPFFMRGGLKDPKRRDRFGPTANGSKQHRAANR